MEMIDQHGVEKPGLDAALGRRSGDDGAARRESCASAAPTSSTSTSAARRRRSPRPTAARRACAIRDRCEAIMRAVVAAVDCPVTMKMRLGWSEDALVYLDVAQARAERRRASA